MNSSKSAPVQSIQSLQNLVTTSWYALRSLNTLGVLLAVLALVVGLLLIIPQETTLTPAVTAENIWRAALPEWLQPAARLLQATGLSRILHSLWFWLPAALLLLHSLIALVDYLPVAWQRTKQVVPSLEQQHPLARRIEHSVRLPGTPQEFLDERKKFLQEKGFVVTDQTWGESEPRIMSATRYRWSWAGLIGLYGGLVILIAACVGSHFVAESDRLTISSLQTVPSLLPAGRFELQAVGPDGSGQVIYHSNAGGGPAQRLTWGRYLPGYLAGTFILPTDIEPVLTLEVQDESGQPLELALLQEELATATRLNVSMGKLDTAIYFTIPSLDLAFQLSPDPAANGTVYNVQVQRGSETTLIENMPVETGRSYHIENLTVALSLNHNVKIFAWRDPALPLYLLGLLLALGGALLVFGLPPSQIWLIPEIKGRGGQLYGVMETLRGREATMQVFLQQLLEGDQVMRDEE